MLTKAQQATGREAGLKGKQRTCNARRKGEPERPNGNVGAR